MHITNDELSTVQLLISTPESLTCYLLIFLSISRNKLLYYTTSNIWHSVLLNENISILPISVLQQFIHLIVGKSVVTYTNISVNSHSDECDQQRKISMYSAFTVIPGSHKYFTFTKSLNVRSYLLVQMAAGRKDLSAH
jgi:hypothetical protein